jgi:hypothetical protein
LTPSEPSNSWIRIETVDWVANTRSAAALKLPSLKIQ